MTTKRYRRLFESSREEKIEYLANDGFATYDDNGRFITSVSGKKKMYSRMSDKDLNAQYKYSKSFDDNDVNPNVKSHVRRLKKRGTLEKLRAGELSFDDLRDQGVPQDVIETLQDELAQSN